MNMSVPKNVNLCRNKRKNFLHTERAQVFTVWVLAINDVPRLIYSWRMNAADERINLLLCHAFRADKIVFVDYATSVKKVRNGTSSHFALFCTHAIFCNKCEKRTQNCVKKRTFLH